MERTNFENLKVYQLAEQLADEIWKLVLTWSILAKDTLGKQMLRSADSISANIAEGSGRGSRRDSARFARYARGSLYETKNWLRRAFRRNLLQPAQIDYLKRLIDELTLTLNGYIRALERDA